MAQSAQARTVRLLVKEGAAARPRELNNLCRLFGSRLFARRMAIKFAHDGCEFLLNF